MATAYTSLLGLALPVTGDLSGTWGTTVNDEITALLDSAIAGTTSITADADITLSDTDGAGNEARQAVILWNPAAGTTTRNITAPARSKAYIVINASGGTQSIVLRGAGPTTGVTIVKGEFAVCAWNGSDFVKVANQNGIGNFTTLNATTVDTTNLEVTNIKAKDGTASIVLADSTGIATFSKATVVETTDNTNAALRITQLGTGNALLVEDSANPDSTPFVIDATGNVYSGYLTPFDYLSIGGGTLNPRISVAGTTGDLGSIGAAVFANATTAPTVVGAKSRNATVGSHTVVQSGDSLLNILAEGSDGTAFIRAASIVAAVDGTPGTNDMPGRLVFSTTADGGSSPTERMRISNAGNLSQGTGGTSLNYSFLQSKTVTGATTVIGFGAQGLVQSDVTSTHSAFRSNATTAAASFTLATLNHFEAGQPALGAGSTVTNQFGFNAGNTLTGATNNYGFYGNIAAASGRYNFYAAGTADNYFAGNVGVGTTSPTSMLQTAGTSAKSAFKTPNIAEVATVSATAATGTINYDVTTQSVLYYTTDASGNFTVNFRGSSGTSLNTIMATGESLSATFLVTNGSTAYYNSAVQVDGSSVTPKWQGGTAPTSGNASSIDSYTYVIIKTASATFTVLASVTKFA